MLIDCPDCGQPLRIQSDSAGQLSIVLMDPALRLRPRERKEGSATHPAATPAVPAPSALPQPAAVSPPGASRAQWIAWSVAAVCLLMLVGVLTRGRGVVPIAENPPAIPPVAATAIPAAVSPTSTPPKAAIAAGLTPLEQRLKKLGELVIAQAQVEGHFPPGQAAAADVRPEDQFSWLATLDASHGVVREPLWDRPWRDPLNDRFVRRRMEMLQNPAIRQLTGADGFPATHFAGVAGVGADAAGLEKDHPRAGIFGTTRTTRPEDVKDGLSHTLLLAGVQEDLGSWAAGGRATVRPFATEPYVNGPDGFGTGQPTSMLVLMADGSVRTVNADTEPRVVRRMAAMADGLPLDPAVEGEPGDRPATAPPPVPPQVAEAVEPPATAVPPAAAAPDAAAAKPAAPAPIDIVAALAQKIRLIDQSTPAPLVQLLVQVEALSGVHIEFDRTELGAAAERLDAPVTLKLQQVTVGEILRELLKRGNLTYRIEAQQIRVIAKPEGT